MAMTNLKENNGSCDKISNQEFCRFLWDLIYQNLFFFFLDPNLPKPRKYNTLGVCRIDP